MGSLAIFGSYIGKERSLTGEAVSVTVLDTSVALIAGLIIFPACSAFHINPDSGPNLIFVTLPNLSLIHILLLLKDAMCCFCTVLWY